MKKIKLSQNQREYLVDYIKAYRSSNRRVYCDFRTIKALERKGLIEFGPSGSRLSKKGKLVLEKNGVQVNCPDPDFISYLEKDPLYLEHEKVYGIIKNLEEKQDNLSEIANRLESISSDMIGSSECARDLIIDKTMEGLEGSDIIPEVLICEGDKTNKTTKKTSN